MATLEQIDEKLDRVGNSLTEVKTVLLGKNGDKGLVGQVEAHERDLDKIKGNYKLLVGILIGSNVLISVATAGLTRLLGG